jgi:hypothetical protein
MLRDQSVPRRHRAAGDIKQGFPCRAVARLHGHTVLNRGVEGRDSLAVERRCRDQLAHRRLLD